jgi:hypothetical protein
LGSLWLIALFLLLGSGRQLEFLGGGDKFKNLVADNQGVEQIHAHLSFLVQNITHWQAHNVSSKHYLNFCPKMLIGDEFLAVEA